MTPTLNTSEAPFPLSAELRDEVEQFVTSQRSGHYLQLPAWTGVHEAGPSRLFVSRDPKRRIVATSVISEIRSRLALARTAEIARGPVAIGVAQTAAHLADVVASVRRDYVAVRANPFITADSEENLGAALREVGFRRVAFSRFYKHTVVVEIDTSSETQWRRLRRSTRTAINKARRSGLEVRIETSAEAYRRFAERFSQFARRRGLSELDESVAERIHSAFAAADPPLTYVLTALHDGTSAGQMLLIRNRDTLVYEWGWTSADGRADNLPISHSLVWHALDIGRDTGCAFLDLGGYWHDRPPSDPSNHFKLGFSKQVTAYAGTYEYVCSPTLYRIQALTSRLASRRG